MEVVGMQGGSNGWTRMNGAMESGRVETSHWSARLHNATHHFGKVVDSRARNLADGSMESRQQSKQLEVFQASVPGGSLQVIRSQSVTTSWHNSSKQVIGGSSSRWSSNQSPAAMFPTKRAESEEKHFDNLKMLLNPLDLSSQKTKASIGRSGSIGGRRPPSRPRSLVKTEEPQIDSISSHGPMFRTTLQAQIINGAVEASEKPSVALATLFNGTSTESISVIENSAQLLSNGLNKGHDSLSRQKSCSTEDLVKEEEVNTFDESDCWQRSSKVRRSLQFAPQSKAVAREIPDLPTTSVAKLRQEIEARKHIVNSVLRGNPWNTTTNEDKRQSGDSDKTPVKKRNSFISVESLNEVRGRLRQVASPVEQKEEVDDGIVTEIRTDYLTEDEIPKSRVKAYVYGMEAMLDHKPVNGTGSLESRSLNKSNSNGGKSEEWYNRRKSYGFEQVNGQQKSHTEKSQVESSTDSGICKSTETVTFPSWPSTPNTDKEFNGDMKISHSVVIKPRVESRVQSPSHDREMQKGGTTVVNLGSDSVMKQDSYVAKGKIADALRSLREKKAPNGMESYRPSDPITISIPVTVENAGNSKGTYLLKQANEQNINDIVRHGNLNNHSSIFSPERNSNSMKQDGKLWLNDKSNTSWYDSELVKRHSIAVDETKYLDQKKEYHNSALNTNNTEEYIKNFYPSVQTTNVKTYVPSTNNALTFSSVGEDDRLESEHDIANEKKHKKVGFCKTEVHFVAESGRFNIVETDGKPPPTNIYRRRRKTSESKTGLPVIRFGDSQYEKNLLQGKDEESSEPAQASQSSTLFHSPENDDQKLFNLNEELLQTESDKEIGIFSEDDNPKPRSILKHNAVKARPFSMNNREDNSWVRSRNFTDVEERNSGRASSPWRSLLNLQDSHETELQKLLRGMRSKRQEESSRATDNGLEVRISSSSEQRRASWSVAERIQHAEDMKKSGYSTRVNFGSGEATVIDPLPSSILTRLRKDSDSLLDRKKSLYHSQSFSERSANERMLPVYKSNTIPFQKDALRSTSLVMNIQRPNTTNVQNIVRDLERQESIKLGSTNQWKEINATTYQPNKHSINEIPNSNEEEIVILPAQIEMVKDSIVSTIKTKIEQNDNDKRDVCNNFKSNLARRSFRKNLADGNIKINPIYEEFKSTSRPERCGIPGALDALDDLSRCIEEVIVEIPKQVEKSDSKRTGEGSVFELVEDWNKRREDSVASELHRLQELLDPGEISDESLRADEEVRAYMSTANEDDSSELSGSWSRVKTYRAINKKRLQDRISPLQSHRIVASTVAPPYVQPASQSVETTPNIQLGQPPKVTSIHLRFEEPNSSEQGNRSSRTSITAMEPAELPDQSHNSSHSWHSLSTADTQQLTTGGVRAERKGNLDMVANHKRLSLSSVTNIAERYIKNERNSRCNRSDAASRRSQSPSKESVFLERNVLNNKRSTNETRRYCSASPQQSVPSNGIFKIQSKVFDGLKQKGVKCANSAGELKISDKVAPSSPVKFTESAKLKSESRQPTTKSQYKKTEIKADSKRKERKLSTSSSGRDGWLNTPKEPELRKDIRTSCSSEMRHKKTVVEPTKVKAKLKHRAESPIYQNRLVYKERRELESAESESAILEELTRAADEILQAVNGYTDEESFKASSDDDYRRTRDKQLKPMSTIAEKPVRTERGKERIQVVTSEKHVRSSGKTKLVESTSEDRSKRRARLLQRASSREMLMQTGASSSEDIASGNEGQGSMMRSKQRVVRRTRAIQSSPASKSSATKQRVGQSHSPEVSQTAKVTTSRGGSKSEQERGRTVHKTVSGSGRAVKSDRGERRSSTAIAGNGNARTHNVVKKKQSSTSHRTECLRRLMPGSHDSSNL